MEKTIHIFHHTDLDGMGVKLLGMLYANHRGIPYKTYKCGYRQINPSVQAILKQPDDIEEIIIGDISVNDETAQLLEQAVKGGMKIRLYDHHESALSLKEYEWAHVQETDEKGISRSGTWVMGQDPDFQTFYSENQFLMDTIDDWDTWNWKKKGNTTARKLNSLVDILDEEEFFKYILSKVFQPVDSEDSLFDDRIKIMLETHRRAVLSQAETCEKNMYTFKLWTEVPIHKDGVQRRLTQSISLKTGMVFVQSSVSEIGDVILDNHPELDILMMIIFPNTISWRTQKQLPISLGRIAKRATGWGGGHPSAAGSTISYSVFQDMITKFMEDSFEDTLDYSNLVSPYIRKLREFEQKSEENEMPVDELLPF